MNEPDAIPQTTKGSPQRIHQKSDVFAPGLLLFLIIMLFCAFIMHAGLWGWLKGLKGPATLDTEGFGNRKAQPTRIAQSYPKLQISPTGDWVRYRHEQELLLKTYGWSYRTNGLVRIPIEEAMARVAAQGIPNWSTNPHAASPVELQQDRAKRGADII